jgi:hypothetical protein
MAGFGSGLAHALTQGVVGYSEGVDENQKKLIVLAAQRRAQQQQDQANKRADLASIVSAAQSGIDVQPDTLSRRSVQGVNPTSPEGGDANQPPAQPSDDGTVLGSIGGMTLRVPPGGVQGKAARDAAQKSAQQRTERMARLSQLNDQLPPPKRKTPVQLQAIAADDNLYNQHVAQATGMASDPLAIHKAERDYDVAHPTREQPETSWQTIVAKDGSYIQVDPKTGKTRPIGQDARPTGSNNSLGSIQARQAAAVIPELSAASSIIDKFDDPTLLSQMSKKAGLLGNYLNTPEGRQLNQAITQFVTLSELAKGNKRPTEALMKRFHEIYAPAPGDDDATRQQKQAARRTLIASVKAVAGSTAQGAAPVDVVAPSPSAADPFAALIPKR